MAKVRPSEDFESISVAFKRMKNILRQAQETKKRVGEKSIRRRCRTTPNVHSPRRFRKQPSLFGNYEVKRITSRR